MQIFGNSSEIETRYQKRGYARRTGNKLVELNVGHTLKQTPENLNPNRDYKKV